MNTDQEDELSRFQNVITGAMQRFLSQPIPAGISLNQERTEELLERLPAVTEKELEKLGHKDSACGICFQPFLAILAEEETASAMESPAFFSGELGVTRLSQPSQCGHLFCRRDITKWIKTGNLTCPMCRKSLVEPGSQPEEEASGFEMHPIDDAFTMDSNMDIHRIFSGQIPAHLSSTFGQHNRQDTSRSDSGRNEYSGMYS